MDQNLIYNILQVIAFCILLGDVLLVLILINSIDIYEKLRNILAEITTIKVQRSNK